LVVSLASCKTRHETPRASYLPLAEAETRYGPLITAANHPTPNQYGTGERIGLFRDASGTVWGLPLSITNDHVILVCAPSVLPDAKITDTFPAGSTIIGAVNKPTGWRGGTGKLELLIRDAQGVHSYPVAGALLPAAPVCWTPESPGPPQQLQYYRLLPK
jgi:hypothetical protein